MNKRFFRIIFSLFVFIIGCCLIFIPINSYNDYSVRNKLQEYYSDYLEHLTSNLWRLFLSIWWVEEDWVKALSDVGILRVFWIYCNNADYSCIYQWGGKDKVTQNYSLILSKGRYDKKSLENVSQFNNRSTSLVKLSNFSEITKEPGNEFLEKYRYSYMDALDKLDWIKKWFNEELAKKELDSETSKNSYRDSIFEDMKASREEWKWFKIKTSVILLFWQKW